MVTKMKHECIDHGKKGNKAGYTTGFYQGHNTTLHRIVYCQHNNIKLKDLSGLVVRHICDNTRCINPEHLILGTYLENTNDMMERNRHICKPSKGKNHYNYMEIDDVALKIKAEYIKDSVSASTTALAKKYGISQSTVYKIVSGKR